MKSDSKLFRPKVGDQFKARRWSSEEQKFLEFEAEMTEHVPFDGIVIVWDFQVRQERATPLCDLKPNYGEL